MNGFYWIYLIMILFLLAYTLAQPKETKRLIYYIALVFLILLFTLQDASVSMDTAEYMRQWRIIPDLSFREMLSHKFEIAYVVLCWFLERTFESDRVLLVVLSILILLPFGRSFERNTEAPMIALMAFLALGMYYHAIVFWRQLAAMAILTFSYRYIQERRLLPFLLVLLAAMSFHKISIVFLGLYILYAFPINKWLLIFCAACSLVLSFFGESIINFGVVYIYPRYLEYPRSEMGGEVLLAALWIVTLLSYWLLHDQLDDHKVRIPFLMTLIAATIQPICFSFFLWGRIVLIFQIALVPMTAHLYTALFEKAQGNKALQLVQAYTPRLYMGIRNVYEKTWFRIAAQILLFSILFLWYNRELDGAVYRMAPIN